jgi:hypothetical protein
VFTDEVDGNLVVVPNGSKLAYREFFEINGSHEYYRISGSAVTYIVGDIDIDTDVIYVSDSTALPVPDLVRAIPGVIFVGGEKITYWENDTESNSLRNIRRGVGGTANQFHPSFTTVYDASVAQAIPEINPRTITISGNVANGDTWSSNSSWNYWKANASTSIFTTVDNPTYKITLNANITVNVGDVITQAFSNGNAVVRGNVTDQKSVAVTFNSGAFATANANCVFSINGEVTSIAPNAVSILGSVAADGNVTITASAGANIVIRQDSLAWIDYNNRERGLQGQDTGLAAKAFLAAGSDFIEFDLDDNYTIEIDDEQVSVNTILMTENSQLLTKED